MHLQILDFDNSVAGQTSLPAALEWSSVETFALTDLAPRLRLWSRNATIDELRARLDAQNAKSRNAITMLGSGDFHHVAALLIERATRETTEPFTVVHVDNHPDWVRFAPRWHCGAWVNRVLELPRVAKVITLGVCSDDLVRPDLKGGNLRALAGGRLVLLPWSHAPSRVWTRMPDGPGHHYDNGVIAWNNLANGEFSAHLQEMLAQIETDAVWITIDKDVLPEAEALSNWDQGRMPLARVLETIRFIGCNKRIAGADICGEYSPAQHVNWFKRIEARIDQPKRAANSAALARNEQINVELLRALVAAETQRGAA